MTVITVSIIYTICWVPACVMYCLIQLSPHLMLLSYQHKVTILLAMFNSSVNPVVYSFTSARFREHVINLFRRKCCPVVLKVEWIRDNRHWSPSSPGQPQWIPRDSPNIYFIALVVKTKRKISDSLVIRKETYCCRLSEHDGVQQESHCYFRNCTQKNLMSFSLMIIYQLICSPAYVHLCKCLT